MGTVPETTTTEVNAPPQNDRRMSGRAEAVVEAVAGVLDRVGIISTERFDSTMSLAWPRIVTGFAIMSKQTVDLAFVGIAVGTAGTAGLAFALAYWQVVVLFGLGLAGGTISLVSQNYGSGETGRASLVIKQSVLLAVAFAVPIMLAFVLFAGPLIGLLGADATSIRQGERYLVFVAPAVLFELFNLIASRTYTGVGDTFTEMVARAGGAILNVVLSGLFIFGAGMGIVGAALGTTLATGFVTLVLGWGMLGRTYGGLGMEPSPVPVTRSGSWLDAGLARQLVEISAPEIGRRFAGGLVVFPLLWIAASFGPLIVTAIEVGRRIRYLINGINWGFSLASSSLVGQHLGTADEEEAGIYGASIIRLTLVTHAVVAALVVAFAAPIAELFVTGSTEVAQTTTFVIVGAVSAIGQGLDGGATGALVGAGDTRWPFVATLFGRYVLALPAAALGLVTPLGIGGLYLALLLETYAPGGINYWRFWTGRWKSVSRRYRPSSG